MTWSVLPYSEGIWSGGVIPNTAPPGQVLPPPIPGATNQYTWNVQPGMSPWSFGGWSGGLAPRVSTAGGIIASPGPDTGTVAVTAWWPWAATLQLVRITPDGARTPVRAAFPVAVTDQTRSNLCPNPTCAAGLNGYLPGAGNPALSVITRTDLPNPVTAWRCTIAADGTSEMVIPAALIGGRRATIGIDLALSVRPASVTITVAWLDGTGAALAASTASPTADQVNASVSQFGRQVVTVTPPSGAVSCATIRITAAGMTAGSTMDGSRVTIEHGSTDGTPFDGDSLGGAWTGVPELSTSVYAPVQTIVDGECPLDVPVSYQVYNPSIVGGWALSAPLVLDSGDQSWLSHPATPSAPIVCRPTLTPTLVRKLPQAILPIIGRARPVVLSASTRLAPAGSALSLDCETFAIRDELLAMLADGQPLLLRAPADYGYGYGQWIALGDVTEDPGGRPAPMQARTLSAPYQEVDPPAGSNLIAT